MLSKLFDAVFGCWHTHYSFPITVRPGSRRGVSPGRVGTYVVCLDCGKEFAYDWREMKVVGAQPKESRPPLVTKEAA